MLPHVSLDIAEKINADVDKEVEATNQMSLRIYGTICQNSIYPSDYIEPAVTDAYWVFYKKFAQLLSPELFTAYMLPSSMMKDLQTTLFFLQRLNNLDISEITQETTIYSTVQEATKFHSKLPIDEQLPSVSPYCWVHGPDHLQDHYTPTVIRCLLGFKPTIRLASVFEIPSDSSPEAVASVLVPLQHQFLAFSATLNALKVTNKDGKKNNFRFGGYGPSWLLLRFASSPTIKMLPF